MRGTLWHSTVTQVMLGLPFTEALLLTYEGAGQAAFRRSSFCGTGECIEVAQRNGVIVLRDSTQPQSRMLNYAPEDWRSFVGRIKAGRFDAPGS